MNSLIEFHQLKQKIKHKLKRVVQLKALNKNLELITKVMKLNSPRTQW
jgi:hypothetical protein